MTVLESPAAVPATPEKVGDVSLDILPSAGWVSVTTGAELSTATVLGVTTTVAVQARRSRGLTG